MNPYINKTEQAYHAQLSTNYEMLYGHLQKGIHVICFMDYEYQLLSSKKHQMRKMVVGENLNYFQGIIFGNLFDKQEDFIAFCQKHNVTFLPN